MVEHVHPAAGMVFSSQVPPTSGFFSRTTQSTPACLSRWAARMPAEGRRRRARELSPFAARPNRRRVGGPDPGSARDRWGPGRDRRWRGPARPAGWERRRLPAAARSALGPSPVPAGASERALLGSSLSCRSGAIPALVRCAHGPLGPRPRWAIRRSAHGSPPTRSASQDRSKVMTSPRLMLTQSRASM